MFVYNTLRGVQITYNPPFVGARMMDQDSEQKDDVKRIFGDIKDVQDLDYVTCWYKLAAKMIYNTNIKLHLFQQILSVREHKYQFFGMF